MLFITLVYEKRQFEKTDLLLFNLWFFITRIIIILIEKIYIIVCRLSDEYIRAKQRSLYDLLKESKISYRCYPNVFLVPIAGIWGSLYWVTSKRAWGVGNTARITSTNWTRSLRWSFSDSNSGIWEGREAADDLLLRAWFELWIFQECPKLCEYSCSSQVPKMDVAGIHDPMCPLCRYSGRKRRHR
jgi:hypothetical protein